ncbi:MAG TPA: hypothetical protein VE935_16380 [Burkholderiales bacterium]|jgi:hypothetical protein|nr:hypothetical protein [Burkholderiales bacterium]
MFTAVVRVSGAGRLADFLERLRWLMVRDPDAEDYTEHHEPGALEYRFAPRHGIPFPAFVEASGEFPELRIEARWDHDGVRGRALIEAGRLVKEEEPPATPGVALELEEDGRLLLALVCERRDGGWLGYAATSDRHSFFRYREALELIAPEQADEALEAIAFRLVDEWLWYDEEEAPAERSRYAQYGMPVRGANVRSERLAWLRRHALRFSSLDAGAAPLREALQRQWLKQS